MSPAATIHRVVFFAGACPCPSASNGTTNPNARCSYIAEGDWNWKDYHQAVRAAAFSLTAVDHPVDSVIDLRGGARPSLPAGASAHIRSFGRVTSARLTGRAAVIGLPAKEAERLGLSPERKLSTADGYVKFVDSNAELERLLAEWAANPPAS